MAPRNNRLNPEMPTRGTANSLIQVLDTYYRPARDVMGERAISEGFNSISNFLGKQAAVEKEQELKEITMKAQQDAMAGADPDEEFSQIRRGLLFRSQSRAYNQAYNETMGMRAAIDFRDNLSLEYEQSGLDRNTDPQAFREWMNERVNTFLTENQDNEYFVAGAMPYMQQTISNMSSAHTSNITRTMEENRIAAMRRQADGIAMQFARGEIDGEALVSALQGVGTAYYETGESGNRVRVELLSSLMDVANATDNLEILDIIDTAFQEGSLQLTPSQWASMAQTREGITRDIEYRRGLAERANERQAAAERASVTDAVTDFYLSDPANLAVSPEAFIGQNSDMADMIRNSPQSRELLEAVREAHQSVTNVATNLSPEAELMNNVMITDEINAGNIQTAGDIVTFLQDQRANGVGFSESNITHAFSELQAYNDPDGVYSTEAYKNFSRVTERGVITALVNEPEFGFMGDTTDAQSIAVQAQYRQFEAERLAALPIQSRRDPRAIREALQQAAQDTHDFYRETDPEFYQDRVDNYAEQVLSGALPALSDPQFERAISDADAAFEQAIAEGSAILFPEGGDPEPATTVPTEQDTSQIDPNIPADVPQFDYREYASAYADLQDYLNNLPSDDRLVINERYVEWFDALSELQQQEIADQYSRSTGGGDFTPNMVRNDILGRGWSAANRSDFNLRYLADRAHSAGINLPDPREFLGLD